MRSFEIMQGIGIALSGEPPVGLLEVILGSRKEAEEAAWRAKTNQADRKAAAELGY